MGVLVCDSCDSTSPHGEYWCSDHADFRGVYFHFVDRFSVSELQQQSRALGKLMAIEQGPKRKNRRTTLRKKQEQVDCRIAELCRMQVLDPTPIPPRRCRACFQPYSECPGECWGFWKRSDTVQV